MSVNLTDSLAECPGQYRGGWKPSEVYSPDRIEDEQASQVGAGRAEGKGTKEDGHLRECGVEDTQ